ncbi:MAG: UDP-Glycosyltransferase/glycogen phosphorylase [Pseudonocardiales bacterium]|nr:UDP-Glycosyltransferase/glycogen phosphorylase [Pseudonocardiales bacterium]
MPALITLPRRIAVLSVHTSPLEQPGGGDAGGLNVYVVETARRLADAGVQVEIFTRATAGSQPPMEEMHPGVQVRHVIAGPFEGLGKNDLPAQLCAFSAAVLRAEATQKPGWYEVIHSHYWLSGQVGWLARDRWRVPLVHSAHTLAKVKNAALADGEQPEPLSRIVGEEQVVAEADRLVAPTAAEAEQLIDLYGADPARVVTVPPGVDLKTFAPGSQADARERLGIAKDVALILFVGRLQPLKAPDVLIRAAAQIKRTRPELAAKLQVAIVGAPSGSGSGSYLDGLKALATSLGIHDRVTFVPPVARAELADFYRAADLTVVPSYNESFGLVALESQACGTPVVATEVGGLTTSVADGVSGALVAGHSAQDWGRVIADLLADTGRRTLLAKGARAHAEQFSWDRTTRELIAVYGEAMTAFREQFQPVRP